MSEYIKSEDLNRILGEKLREHKVSATSDDLEALKNAFVLLYNRINIGVAYNSNITICAGEQETANEYGNAIAEMLEIYFPQTCAVIDEDELYGNKPINRERKECNVRLVRNFKGTSPELLFRCLDKLEKNGWPLTIILCTTANDAEAIKEYDMQDYRLYNYMCGYKVIIPEVSESNITELTCERLKQNGYILTEGFEKKLDAYIRAVYPGASLAKKPFMEDLIYRIYQVHYQKLVDGMQLDESDVPYSVKAEKLHENELKNISEKNETETSKTEGNVNQTTEEEIQRHQLHENELKNKSEKNETETSKTEGNLIHTTEEKIQSDQKILILTLGTGPLSENGDAGYRPTQYEINGKTYQKNGQDVKTNFVAEPIIDAFMPDEIFILGTVTSNWFQFYASTITTDNKDQSYINNEGYKRLLKIKKDGKISTSSEDLEGYSKEITGIFSTINTWQKYSSSYQDKKPNIHILLTKYGVNEEELKENYRILKNIETYLDKDKTYEVAFDVTHSFRSLPIYNLIIFNYIKSITKYKLSISHVYYGMVEIKKENNDKAPIVDLVDIVNILSLTNGVAEFKDTGNAVALFDMLDDRDALKTILKDFDLATQLNAFDKIKKKLKALYDESITNNKAIEDRYTGIREMIGSVLQNRFFEDESIDKNELTKMSDADFKFYLTKWFFNQNRIGLGLATGLEALRDMVTPAFMTARGFNLQEERKYRENAESYFITIARRFKNNNGLSELQQAVRKLGVKLLDYKNIRNVFAHSLSNQTVGDLDTIKGEVDNFKKDFYALRELYCSDKQAFNALFAPTNNSSASASATGKECRVMLVASGDCKYKDYKKSKSNKYDVYYLPDNVKRTIFGGITEKQYPAAEKAYFLCEYLKKYLPQNYNKMHVALLTLTNPEYEFVFRLYLENLFDEKKESIYLEHLADQVRLECYGKIKLVIDANKMKNSFNEKELEYTTIMERPLLEVKD